jgi:hypothetical protein
MLENFDSDVRDAGKASSSGSSPFPDKPTSAQSMNQFSRAIVVMLMISIILGCILGVSLNLYTTGLLLSPAYFFFMILCWAATLDRECSLRPLQLCTFLCAFGVFGPCFVTPASFDEASRNDIYWAVMGVFGVVVFGIAWMAYKTLEIARRCLQQEYGSKMLSASVRMSSYVAGCSAYVCFMVINTVASFMNYAWLMEEYAAHTPYCSLSPDGPKGSYNSKFVCQGSGNAIGTSGARFSSGDHFNGHNKLGLSSIALFTSPATFLSFDNATALAAGVEFGPCVAQGSPVTNETAWLTAHDFMRIVAEREALDFAKEGFVSVLQGMVFILILAVGQVFLRVTRSSFADVLTGRIAITEGAVVFVTVLEALVSALAGAMSGHQFFDNIVPLIFVMDFCMFWQLALTYKMCWDILTDKHKHLKARLRRASSLPDDGGGGLGEVEGGIEMRMSGNPMHAGGRDSFKDSNTTAELARKLDVAEKALGSLRGENERQAALLDDLVKASRTENAKFDWTKEEIEKLSALLGRGDS